MFCYQCEQSARGIGCDKIGLCGKTPEQSDLQDAIFHGLKSLSIWMLKAKDLGIKDKEVDTHIYEALFSIVTNVNFDTERLYKLILKTSQLKEKIKEKFFKKYKKQYNKDFSKDLIPITEWSPPTTIEKMIEEAKNFNILKDSENEDIRSLRHLLRFGIEGMAAYAYHAEKLGATDESITDFFYKALESLTNNNLTINDYINLNMECGKINLKCMEILNKANISHFGIPVPTEVEIGHEEGPAILVSGHDLLDLYELLKQTEGTGINIYTHGEMLPAHGYPELKKFKHLVGNYGGAWQNQQKEFDEFPGPILMTTNCIQKPKPSYIDRIFTTGPVAFTSVTHIASNKDFSLIIKKAKELGGFKSQKHIKKILVGFGHNTVLSIADKIIENIKNGKIKHFYLIGGCDGAKSGRNYYTKLAESVPNDSIILTLACGKYRFNKLDFGRIDGIPRLLDVGQCNDAYSAIQIALTLSKVFNVGVNELPLSLILSWYEQKAIVVLLTLLSIGFKNIKIGPSLPAFLSKNVLNYLVENFNLTHITNIKDDLF